MRNKERFQSSMFRMIWCAVIAMRMVITAVFALMVVLTPPAQAQTFAVIHVFDGGGDGAHPYAGLTTDAAGNLYGTTSGGGITGGAYCTSYGCGTVFKLSHKSSGWVLNPLYAFAGGNDGFYPAGRVAIAEDGTLFGTTEGGEGSCCGTVFRLRPSLTAPRTALAPWDETVIHRFSGVGDGLYPQGDLTFDRSGNIYGTTTSGGSSGFGTIYEVTPSGGGWTETVLYSPAQLYRGNGSQPHGGVIFDNSGNLYGGFNFGGSYDYGAVDQLSLSGPGWTEQTLHPFGGGSDGANPEGGLIIDASGDLYGTTTGDGDAYVGTVFELTPANGGWIFNTLYQFSGQVECGPKDKLIMDAAGNLYGTTYCNGASSQGSVFKLTRTNGGWTYTSLYDFTGAEDGRNPISNLVLDANGNLYGTTSSGGMGYGVVFEITP